MFSQTWRKASRLLYYICIWVGSQPYLRTSTPCESRLNTGNTNSISASKGTLLDGRTVWRGFACYVVVFSQADIWHTRFGRCYVEWCIDLGKLSPYKWQTKLVEKYLIPQLWLEFIKPIESPSSRSMNREIINVRGIVSLFVGKGDLCLPTYYGIVENLAIDELLETSVIDSCICLCRIILAKWSLPLSFKARRKHYNEDGNKFYIQRW